jgi:hypothetical protein
VDDIGEGQHTVSAVWVDKTGLERVVEDPRFVYFGMVGLYEAAHLTVYAAGD